MIFWQKKKRAGANRPAPESKVTVSRTDGAAPPAAGASPAAAPIEPVRPAIAATPTASKPPSETVDVDVLAELLRGMRGFYFAPSQAAIDGLPAGAKVESISLREEVAGNPVLKLAGGDLSAASFGHTGGFSIRVPDAFEREASERRVRVRVLARSAAGAPARVAIAYSTNEVGNSGWIWAEVGPSWRILEIIWSVPKMDKGKGDFIGILPNRAGAPGVEIHSLSADVI